VACNQPGRQPNRTVPAGALVSTATFSPYTDRRLTVVERLADAMSYFEGIVDVGYCIDAPELVPAGAVGWGVKQPIGMHVLRGM
jgi:hypothetical protein